VESGLLELGNPPQRFNERLLEILKKANIYIIGAHEFEQFAYEFNVKVDGDKVVLKTDESDVSAFLKVLVHEGAKVEVYSAHNFPDSEHGRGK
jgi:UDP-N-acetylmuramyl pentapeptide synthase